MKFKQKLNKVGNLFKIIFAQIYHFLTTKFIYWLKSYYISYKYENLIYKQYVSQTPRWEKYVAYLYILINLFVMILMTFNYIGINNYISFFFGIFSLIFALTFGLNAKRKIKSLNAYYHARKGGLHGPILKRSVFTSTVILKSVGPLAKVCAQCIGVLVGCNYLYGATYNITPSREIMLAFAKKQTWDQAKHHLINPTEYHDTSYDPYITDLERENMKQSKAIEELKKQINDLNSKFPK